MSFVLFPEENEFNAIQKRELDDEMKQKFDELHLKYENDKKAASDLLPKRSEEEVKELQERAKFFIDQILSAWADKVFNACQYEIDYKNEKSPVDLIRSVSLGLVHRGFVANSSYSGKYKLQYNIKFDTSDPKMYTLDVNELPGVKDKIKLLWRIRQRRLQQIEDESFRILNEWINNGQQNVKAIHYDDNQLCEDVAQNLHDKYNCKIWCEYKKKKREFVISFQC